MPAERSRGSRRTGADGNQLVWTEPALAPGIAFATNLTPGAFEESNPPSSPSDLPPSSFPVETKPEPTTPSPTFFMFDAPIDELKPKRASHKRKPTPPPPSPAADACSPSPSSTDATGAPSPTAHIPRPPNAFILFRSSFIRAGAVPAAVEPSHASLSTIAGLTWAALPAPEKDHWYKKAKEERERHRERFPGYAFRPRHRTTSTSTPSSATDDDGGGSSSNSAGGGAEVKPRRRQQREVPPADRARQAHIASLILSGLSGAALDEATAKFDAERRERGEGGVEVRFGVVETPEGRVAASEACEKAAVEKREASPCVRRSTMKAEKRRPSAKEEGGKSKDTKRRRTASSPSSPSPSLPTSPVDTEAKNPFAFAFDALSIPSTPVDDYSTATFDWPYSSPSSPACFTPFDSYPPSPALSHASSAPTSAWASLEDLSVSLPTHSITPSPLSACSSMSSIGGDLSSLASLTNTAADCSSMMPMPVDLSMSMSIYDSGLAPFDLGLELGMDMSMGMGSMGFLTSYMEGTQAEGLVGCGW